MDFNDLIKKRASIRKYSDKKIDLGKIIEIINSGNLAPSPGNLDILKFIIVEDKEKIKGIAEASQQLFIQDAPIVVVICSDHKRTKIMYDEFAEKYIKHHVGAAVENMLLKITDLGLASCWIGAFVENQVKSILKIPAEIEVEVILPIANKHHLDKTVQKEKHSIDGRVYFEKWNNKLHEKLSGPRRVDI